MAKIHDLLQWLRIEDEDGVFSFTWAMFVLVAYLLIAGKQVSLTEMGAFLGVLLSYGNKRHVEMKKEIAAGTDTTESTSTTIVTEASSTPEPVKVP